MKRKWVVVINRTSARVFSAEFELIDQLRNPLGREKNRALKRDEPGIRHGKFKGTARVYNLTGEKNPHDDAAADFAKEVSQYLTKYYNLGLFDQLIIAAEPRMLGWLKSEMSKQLLDCAEWEPKDYGKLSPTYLRQKMLRSGYEF